MRSSRAKAQASPSRSPDFRGRGLLQAAAIFSRRAGPIPDVITSLLKEHHTTLSLEEKGTATDVDFASTKSPLRHWTVRSGLWLKSKSSCSWRYPLFTSSLQQLLPNLVQWLRDAWTFAWPSHQLLSLSTLTLLQSLGGPASFSFCSGKMVAF